MKRETLDWLNRLLFKAALFMGVICSSTSLFHMEQALDFLLPISIVLISGCAITGFLFMLKDR